MNLGLTLQHGIGLQQLLLDLIHLLALPTHRRHIWHHQLTGLWSRATRMSVGSQPNLAEEQLQCGCPSLLQYPLSHILAAMCLFRIYAPWTLGLVQRWWLLHHVTLTAIISMDGCARDMNQRWCRLSDMLCLRQSCPDRLLCTRHVLQKLLFGIINRLKSGTPCRMTAGIRIISPLQQDERVTKNQVKKEGKRLTLVTGWLLISLTNKQSHI